MNELCGFVCVSVLYNVANCVSIHIRNIESLNCPQLTRRLDILSRVCTYILYNAADYVKVDNLYARVYANELCVLCAYMLYCLACVYKINQDVCLA